MVIWIGFFLYLLRVEAKVDRLEKRPGSQGISSAVS